MISKDSSIDTVKGYLIEACVLSARMKGLSDASGVLRGTLLLSQDPLYMDDLVEMTGYSKSTVSTNMNLLENIGLVRRIITPGDKRYLYAPVIDTDTLRSAMLTNVKREILLLQRGLDLAERHLDEEGIKTGEIRERIASIRSCYGKAERLLDLMADYTTDELIAMLESAGFKQ